VLVGYGRRTPDSLNSRREELSATRARTSVSSVGISDSTSRDRVTAGMSVISAGSTVRREK
jgi:hypothetical protein